MPSHGQELFKAQCSGLHRQCLGYPGVPKSKPVPPISTML